MRKKILSLAIILLLLPTLACGLLGGGSDEAAPAESADENERPAEITDLVDAVADAAVEAGAPEEAVTEVEEAAEAVGEGEVPPEAITEVETAVEAVAEAVEEVELPPEAKAAAETSLSELTETESVGLANVAGPDELSTFRVNFVMDFDGTSGGQPAVGQVDLFVESTKDPKALHMSMQMDGTTVETLGGGSNKIEFYQVGDTFYLYNEAMGGDWITMPAINAEAFTKGFFVPHENLKVPVSGDCDPNHEVVNNITVRHCSFTHNDLSPDEGTFASLKGDVWLAVDGNYIVKYLVEAEGYQSSEGKAELFEYGNVNFLYELYDANADFTISPPE
jgi:predicted small lipoprotein YifL